MSKPLGGGIIGAGPVTQAIHLPYPLNSKRPAARSCTFMDVNAEVGAFGSPP